MPALKTIVMLEEYEKKKRKQISMMKSIMDYSMGVVFILIGAFFFFREKINSPINNYLRDPNAIDKIIGVVFCIYGIWRIYRGYKKNYFR